MSLTFLEILGSGIVVRALIAALVTGLSAPAVGTYLVQRRLSLLGDGIGHISVTGVALGLLTGTSPTWTAIIVAILGALVIEMIRSSGRTTGDLALALLFYGGLAGGLVLVSLAGDGTFALQQYLFGSLMSLSDADVWISVILAVIAIGLALALRPQLYAVSNDEEFARASGLPVTFYNVLISVLAAVSVSIAMRTVGLLLISALMIIPVATAQQYSRGFKSTMLNAMVVGTGASLLGVVVSALVNLPPGATIVLIALAAFVATWPIGVVQRRRRRERVPFPADEVESFGSTEHPHRHGPNCGHPAVEHGDHVDYLHDGHRHAVHGGHYDEH